MSTDYLWHLLVVINLYSMLALSLNLVVGYAGLLSLCQAAFYGIGAYATTLLVVNGHWGFLAALLAAALVAALLSLLIAIPALRLSGDYFVLATLAFQMITYNLLYNWESLTGGPYGIADIPPPRLLGWVVDSPLSYFALSSVFAALCILVLRTATKSPFGRVIKAIREDEMATQALGKNTAMVRIVAFALSAALAAVPGGLFAGYARYIDPTSFTLTEAIFILSIVAIGGAGNLRGPLIGTVFLVGLPELLRLVRIPDTVAASARQIIYGLLLLALMRFRPQGIQGEYRFQ